MHNTKNEKTTLVPLQKLENYPQVFPTRFVNCNQQQQKKQKTVKTIEALESCTLRVNGSI